MMVAFAISVDLTIALYFQAMNPVTHTITVDFYGDKDCHNFSIILWKNL